MVLEFELGALSSLGNTSPVLGLAPTFPLPRPPQRWDDSVHDTCQFLLFVFLFPRSMHTLLSAFCRIDSERWDHLGQRGVAFTLSTKHVGSSL
jgi:hypothetical protein